MKMICLAVALLVFGSGGVQLARVHANAATSCVAPATCVPWGGVQEYGSPGTYYFYFAP
jgi:hypothetical protein